MSGRSQRSFTEAVPLSLSSMAHMSFPLQEGVLDGLKQVLQHTLLSCVNYARAVHPPHRWTFDDLTTSKYAWTGCKGEQSPPRDLPWALTKLNFQHQYARHAWIYFRPAVLALNRNISQEEEIANLKDWPNNNYILGRVSLLYASQELLTKGELDGTEVDSYDEMPPIILYKVVVEYRSLPATGSQPAVQAEELSMLSFGGSVDDDVKLGALASLYDEQAKYVLEIYSVRGKKYKFDLMDSTLSDGTVPQLPSTNEHDPFVKSLCVTVTDHASTSSFSTTPPAQNQNDDSNDDSDSNNEDSNNNNNNQAGKQQRQQQQEQKYAVTRIHLTLDGNLRKGKNLENLPRFDYISKQTIKNFLLLNPRPPRTIQSSPSGQNLLLDQKEAGRIYINGRYVTTWGEDPRIGDHHIALFGMDLRSVPFWHGQITDYDSFKRVYAQLWQEVLIDARLIEYNLAKRLLFRLIYGQDKNPDEVSNSKNNKNKNKNSKANKNKNGTKNNNDSDDEGNDDENDDYDNTNDENGDDDSDEDDDSNDDDDDDDGRGSKRQRTKQPPNTNVDCLESQVLQSTKFDPVGIASKALATRFSMEFGKNAYPCLANEVNWCKANLPHRKAVVVPQRALNVLRRGGYHDIEYTANELWFTQCRNPTKRDHDDSVEKKLIKSSINLLQQYADCYDVKPANIVFVPTSSIPFHEPKDAISKKAICKYNEPLQQYHINEQLLKVSVTEYIEEQKINQKSSSTSKNDSDSDKKNDNFTEQQILEMNAFLLGMYVAQEHPDGSVLVRYLLRSSQPSLFPTNNSRK